MSQTSPADSLVSAAVRQLLAFSHETPTDVAHHIGLSTASLYRRLAGDAKWAAKDVWLLAQHYKLQPGDIYQGANVPNPFVLPEQRNRRAGDRRGRLVRTAHGLDFPTTVTA